jgi:hypothetical protein
MEQEKLLIIGMFTGFIVLILSFCAIEVSSEFSSTETERAIAVCGEVCNGMGSLTVDPDGTTTCTCAPRFWDRTEN